MVNIWVTGSEGQLGSELHRLSVSNGNSFFFTDIEEVDIADFERVKKYMEENKIDVVINCAAYTAVDRAEEDLLSADIINNIAVKNLAESCKKLDAMMIHISTDFVFSGKKNTPYLETDTPDPINVYGKTKLAGELAVWTSRCKSIIIRTAWLYSVYGSNFVKTMLHMANRTGVEEIKVIYDQIGTPTYAEDLARTILAVLPSILAEPRHGEIYNYSNEGTASWYDFAHAILDLAKMDNHLIPIETSQYRTLALRPHYSVLNKTKIKEEFGLTIPHWYDSLVRCMERMEKEKQLMM